MIQSNGARRMIAAIAIAAAVLAQDAAVSVAGANHETATIGFLSADRLIPDSLSLAEPAPEALYGVRLDTGALSAPETSSLASKSVKTRLTLLDLGEAEPLKRDARFRWPVNRDSAGAPIVLNSDFTAPLINVSF